VKVISKHIKIQDALLALALTVLAGNILPALAHYLIR
jgi:hypothetical protein